MGERAGVPACGGQASTAGRKAGSFAGMTGLWGFGMIVWEAALKDGVYKRKAWPFAREWKTRRNGWGQERFLPTGSEPSVATLGMTVGGIRRHGGRRGRGERHIPAQAGKPHPQKTRDDH
jgi:hypothetical protein